ncbi:MAG: hypothetical protein V3S24_18340, partial [Candidatus Tectomicrobia bacterium]
QGWQRRFNLLEPLTLYLKVADTGRYQVLGEGVKAQFRVEPFLTRRPPNYESPDFESSGYIWDLQRGYYVLSARPTGKGKGIMTLSVQPQAKQNDHGQPARVQTSVVFPNIYLRSNHRYTLYLNQQPGIKAGVVLRSLPIDLSQPLPLSLAGGKTQMLPVRIPGPGRITVRAEGGMLADFVVNHGPRVRSLHVQPGEHVMQVYNTGSDPTWYSVNFAPARLAFDTPLPPLSDKALDRLPDFPVLDESRTHYTDVKRKQQTTLLVKVDEPGLYRLESTGLLQTAGNLRTRTQPSLERRAANGVGRNFLVQPYLREGDYQLSVTPQGRTMGHMGLRLKRTHLHQGGQLHDGIAARFTLPAGDGLSYQLDIPDEGRYRLRSFGLNRDLRLRLEDRDGWPLLRPGTKADVDRTFTAGRHQLTILPEAVDTRVLTLLERIAPEVVRTGHGPHDLELNQTVGHRWLEPQPNASGQAQPRLPDQWRFTVPADVTVTMTLKDPMQGELFRIDSEDPKTPVVHMAPSKAWKGALPAGDYRLQVVSARRNNRLDYTVSVITTELVAGQHRDIVAPETISIAIGSDSLIDISSYGNQDVRARLYDSHGRLVGQNDDRANDWNFAIVGHLSQGRYQLRVEPVGKTESKTRISIYQPQEILASARQFPLHDIIRDPHLHSYPLLPSADKPLLVFTARGRDNVGMALDIERLADGDAQRSWQTLASATGINPHMAVVLNKDTGNARYRFRVWSIDRRLAPIEIQAQALAPTVYNAQELFGQGITLTPVHGLKAGLGVAAVKVDQPGLIQLQPPFDRLQWATDTHRAFSANNSGLIAVAGRWLWVAGPLDRIGQLLRAHPVSLQDGRKVAFVVPATTSVTVQRQAMHATDGNAPVTVLSLAESRVGQPGVQIGPGPLHAMGVAKNAAIAVWNEPATTPPLPVRVWNADPATGVLPVTLRQFSFPPVEMETLPWGRHDMTLDVMQARFYELPAGLKRLRLVLPSNTAAVLRHQGVIQYTFWPGDDTVVQDVDNPVDRLQLLHTGDGIKQASITLFPITPTKRSAELTRTALFKRHFPSAGTFYLPVQVDADDTTNLKLKFFGHDVAAMFMSQSGRIQRGTEIQIGDSGLLALQHGAGLLVAWLEDQNGQPQLEYPATGTQAVQLPAHVALAGTSMTLTLDQRSTTQLHLRTATPVIADIQAGEHARQIKIFPDGADASIYLPTGRSAVTLQAVEHGELSGNLALFGDDIPQIHQGLGAKVELAPGETRLFAFVLTQPGRIGVGVRASTDIATCRLLDMQGKTLGEGVIQAHRLDPGTYLLAVMNPPHGTAVTIQPALVGSRPPDTGPPQEVIRRYRELAGLKAIGGK